ncbi:NYN domain-containing protein [Aneurinibacillus thermoaerophilus]|uniref:NYN domain-containing protein n=2 Tax=Aneurinibacillus thermoaerophilus TaxID=143495 RepID=A0ABX8YGS0_ANETH|nr:NYN domain-containing protein [Aneurinibacillus thermoaerophilus]
MEEKFSELKAISKVVADAFSSSTEKTLQALSKQKELDNVAVFVDYDNVYWTLMNTYSHNPDHEDPQKNLFVKLWRKYGQDNVRTFRAYADFEKIRTQLTSLQKKRIQIRHVYSNGKDGDHRKNSSDIELCIDAIESTYKDSSITCYVFVTADSDMIPIISRMMYKGKRVELYYLSEAAPKHIDMTSFVHYHEDLLDFLNVEVKSYDIEDYIIEGLLFIKQWQEKYEETDRFLGIPWLRMQYASKFSLPGNKSSELIEKMKLEGLIEEKRKFVKGENKLSLSLTEKGLQLLEQTVSEAATGEE